MGGFLGPFVLGQVDKMTGSFHAGIYFLAATMGISAAIILGLGLGGREEEPAAAESRQVA